jgi:hypothetical protein
VGPSGPGSTLAVPALSDRDSRSPSGMAFGPTALFPFRRRMSGGSVPAAHKERRRRTGVPAVVEGDEDEMRGTRTVEELSAPLGAVDMGHLVFAHGAAHLDPRRHRARHRGRAYTRAGRADSGSDQVH